MVGSGSVGLVVGAVVGAVVGTVVGAVVAAEVAGSVEGAVVVSGWALAQPLRARSRISVKIATFFVENRPRFLYQGVSTKLLTTTM